MAAAATFDFYNEILTVSRLYGTNVPHHAKFYQKRSSGSGDMAIERFSKWRQNVFKMFDILIFEIQIFNGRGG